MRAVASSQWGWLSGYILKIGIPSCSHVPRDFILARFPQPTPRTLRELAC